MATPHMGGGVLAGGPHTRAATAPKPESPSAARVRAPLGQILTSTLRAHPTRQLYLSGATLQLHRHARLVRWCHKQSDWQTAVASGDFIKSRPAVTNGLARGQLMTAELFADHSAVPCSSDVR